MRETLAENISYLHALTALAFDPDGQQAQALEERERRERVFLSRHCLDWWDLEEALRNIYDCFLDTVEIDGPIRRKLKKKKSTRIPFDHCADVLEALRYVYLLDEDETLQRRKEFNNKFLWHFFIVPIIDVIRDADMCDVDHPEIMMVSVSAILDEVRNIISEDDSHSSFEDACVARSVMMGRMK